MVRLGNASSKQYNTPASATEERLHWYLMDLIFLGTKHKTDSSWRAQRFILACGLQFDSGRGY